MGGNLQKVSGQLNANGTFTVTIAEQSADKKTASVVRVTAKTQNDAFARARQDSQRSLSGSLTLPLNPPGDAVVDETVATATRDASGAIHAGADSASYSPNHRNVSGVHPQEAMSASSLSGALASVNERLHRQVGSAFDAEQSDIAAVLDDVTW